VKLLADQAAKNAPAARINGFFILLLLIWDVDYFNDVVVWLLVVQGAL
jgi:hypothetical protein